MYAAAGRVLFWRGHTLLPDRNICKVDRGSFFFRRIFICVHEAEGSRAEASGTVAFHFLLSPCAFHRIFCVAHRLVAHVSELSRKFRDARVTRARTKLRARNHSGILENQDWSQTLLIAFTLGFLAAIFPGKCYSWNYGIVFELQTHSNIFLRFSVMQEIFVKLVETFETEDPLHESFTENHCKRIMHMPLHVTVVGIGSLRSYKVHMLAASKNKLTSTEVNKVNIEPTNEFY